MAGEESTGSASVEHKVKDTVPCNPGGFFCARMIGIPPKTVAAKIVKVQGELEAITPMGEMKVSATRTVRYITKHQIVDVVKPLMAKHGLACIYGGIDRIEILGTKTTYRGTPREEYTETKERFWIVFHLVDVDTGDWYSQSVPSDVSGIDSKNATIALAYGERGFLSEVFLVHSKELSAEEEEMLRDAYSPMSIAKNAGMEDLTNSLRIKAVSAVRKVTQAKFGAEVKRRGVQFTTLNPDDMNPEELMQAVLISMDLMNPDKAKAHLNDVLGNKEKDPE